MRIDKVEWITAHNCGKPKMEFIHVYSLSYEKGKLLRPRIIFLTKCALDTMKPTTESS